MKKENDNTKTFKMLVVEDAPPNQMLLMLLLQKMGHEVTIANNGKEAVEIALEILNGKEVLVLDFRAFLGSEDEYDSIKISGIPDISQKISPCINGDIGTISMVINSIPRVIEAPPGLITMRDLPPPIVTP